MPLKSSPLWLLVWHMLGGGRGSGLGEQRKVPSEELLPSCLGRAKKAWRTLPLSGHFPHQASGPSLCRHGVRHGMERCPCSSCSKQWL